MTDKELKRLGRAELVEMLLAQVDENEKLKTQLKEIQEQLDRRQIAIHEAGSIAEAALRLNGVFEAAQTAAAEYLENVKRMSGEGEALLRGMEEEAKQKAEAIRKDADEYSRKTREQADVYKTQVVSKVQVLLQGQEELRALLRSAEEGQSK